VGWLVTKQYQTTTIIYYAFFLPGIILHEFVYWMVAGFLNVRADRVLAWPEKQEIGQLKLNFIKLSKNVGPIKLAVISTAPLIFGLAVVWLIANNVFHIEGFLKIMGSGELTDVSAAVRQLTATPDFWIWFYLTFTISNTMMPHTIQHLRGWWVIIGAIAAAAVVLIFLGAGNQVLVNNLGGPVNNSLNILSGTLLVIMGIDIFMVGVLGTIEALIERVTGDSATFKDGKMITMRRSEALALRAQQMKRQPKSAPKALPSGPPSIYKLALSIPPGPGKEPVTRDEGLRISPAPTPAITAPSQPPKRIEPSVIPGTTSDRPTMQPASTPSPNAPPASPSSAPSAPPASNVPGMRTPPVPPGSGAAPPPRPPGSPAPSPARPPAAPLNRPQLPARADPDDADEDEDFDDEEEMPKPPGAAPLRPPSSPMSRPLLSSRPEPEDEDEDVDNEEREDQEEADA
jgi:hypothetical protein